MNEEPLCIHLCEEYGYRYWLWYPGMEADELATWWKGIQDITVYFFNPGTTLPGHLVQVERFDDHSGNYAHIHWHDDSYLRLGSAVHHHAGYKQESDDE